MPGSHQNDITIEKTPNYFDGPSYPARIQRYETTAYNYHKFSNKCTMCYDKPLGHFHLPGAFDGMEIGQFSAKVWAKM